MSAEKIGRVVSKLEEALKAGDFYGALQLYRTVIKRRLDAGSVDEAQDLLVQGATTLCRHGKAMEGADLGDMMLKSCFEAKKVPLAPRAVDLVADIAASFPARGAVVAGGGGGVAGGGEAGAAPASGSAEEKEEKKAVLARINFLRAAVRWADHAPTGDASEEEADALRARLHLLTARAAAVAGPDFYPDAQRHFLQAAAPAEFGGFVWRWAGEGYAREADLFLARAVLQLLALGNLGDANGVRDEVSRLAEAGGKPLDTPLAHFLRFLLLTLERDARPLFSLLLTKYEPSTSRDPSFAGLLQTIGYRFYGISPPRSGMDGMISMLRGMLGEGGGEGGPGGGGGGMPRGLEGLLGGLGGGGGGGGSGGLPFPFPFPFPGAAPRR